MIVGKIVGKTNTIGFSFVVKNPVNKFDYVQVLDDSNNYNLCQIVELERDENKIVAFCRIVGHKDSEGRVVGIRVPFKPNSEVLKASDDFIKEILNLNVSNGAFVGTLENKRIPIYLNLNELLSKHIAILAKSGYGKSYTAGVLIEEILEHNIPIVIIDPHGEYGALRFPNSNKDEIDKLSKLSLNPKGFSNVFEYVISEEQRELVAKDGILLKLPDYFSLDEINSLFPKKLSNTQMALLYDALHRAEKPTLSNIIYALDLDDNPVKYSMIPVLEHVKNTKLFSETSTPFDEFVKPGNCSVVNLKAINPFLQGLVVYKLVNMIFNLRKKNIIPPFFLLIEEAHNFIPERTFGEKISSKILRIVASEGRKFGLSLGIISQRPARVDKSVLSQCTTNIILRITNPSDIKAVVHSFEGITNDIEKEISILPVGTAIITGLFESPVFVNVRPKKSKHGGSSIDLINNEYQKYKDKKDLDAMNINKTYHDKVNTTVTVETRVSKRDKSENHEENKRPERKQTYKSKGNNDIDEVESINSDDDKKEKKFFESFNDFKKNSRYLFVFPKISKNDALIMSNIPKNEAKVSVVLIPVVLVNVSIRNKKEDNNSQSNYYNSSNSNNNSKSNSNGSGSGNDNIEGFHEIDEDSFDDKHNLIIDLIKGDVIIDIDEKKIVKWDKVNVRSNKEFKAIECFYEPKYQMMSEVNPDKVLKAKINGNQMITRINDKFKVNSFRNCYVVTYVVKRKNNSRVN